MEIPGFEQLEKIAESGFASYWQGYQRSLDRHATLVVMRPDSVSDPEARRAFLRDIRIVAGLKHPAIFQVYDVMELDATLIVSVEHLSGLTLRQYVRQRGAVRPEKALTIARWVAEGLGHLYEKTGLAHLALTPDQIWINSEGQVKILGFGFSDILQRIGYSHLDVPYLSPEQVQHQPCDSRSDAYALGAVLYFMLTGHSPFEGNSPEQILGLIVKGQLPAPLAPGAGNATAINQLLYRVMMKDPEKRYPGWLPAMQDMDKILDGAKFLSTVRKGGLSTIILAPPAAGKPGVSAAAPDAAPPPVSKSSMATSLLVLGVIAALWLWIGVTLWRMPPPVQPSGSPAPESTEPYVDPAERADDQRPSARVRVVRQPSTAPAAPVLPDVPKEETNTAPPTVPAPVPDAPKPAAATRPAGKQRVSTPFEQLTDQVARLLASADYAKAVQAVEEADKAEKPPADPAQMDELRKLTIRCSDPATMVFTVLRRQIDKKVSLMHEGKLTEVVIKRIDGRNVMIVEAVDPDNTSVKKFITLDPAKLTAADQLRLLELETDPEFAVTRILLYTWNGSRDKALGITPDAGILSKSFQRVLTGVAAP
jgi:hypothetical protein